MPRVSRNSITSKYIHVITQGIDKEYIFERDSYKEKYITLFNKVSQEFNMFKSLAYCIMDNHAHFLIYLDDIRELSKIMSKINTSYGIFYNNQNDRVGYVFKNRFYTQQIVDEKHLFNTFAYIHKNPVKAGIVKKENEYNYSSYNMYVRKNVNKEIIKLIFGQEDYINKFYYIHKNFSNENIIDIKEEQQKSEQEINNIIIQFCKKYNCDLNNVKKDNYLLILLIKEIKNKLNVTNKMLAEYIKIGKNRITNLIKQ